MKKLFIVYEKQRWYKNKTKRLKIKLAEYFKIYNLDEFRTSCLNYKTETKCENLYLLDDSSAQLKTTKVKPKLVLNIKPINKAKVISKIQQLLDEINT